MSYAARVFCWMFLALFVVLSTPLHAGIAAIHKDKLPQDASVLSAYEDIKALEPYVKSWSPQWTHPIAKESAVARLQSSMAALQKAAAAAPESEELQLLLGLCAHYAYNVDEGSAFEVAVAGFEKAGKLTPVDLRPDWFLGTHYCQSLETKQGMERFLAIEARSVPSELPVAFWDDYMNCATVTNMPAHVLRAASNAAAAGASDDREFLVSVARKRTLPVDAEAEYEAKRAWSYQQVNDGYRFLNSACGMEISSKAEWQISFPPLQKGTCVAQIKVGPYNSITPNLLLLARQAKPGETLADFLQSFLAEKPSKPSEAPACPVSKCLAIESLVPGMYKDAGDGLGLLAAFERDAPRFPGILFEQPWAPPKDKEGLKFYHPDEALQRMPGKLYYLVLLDTATSVKDQARADYTEFLKSMRVE